MATLTAEQKIHFTLRIAISMCFLGHGAFGIITKEIWTHYFAVFGIGRESAYRLMPLVGAVDIMLGIAMLVYPIRAIAGWLVVWGLLTAMLRPLAGEPVAELIERGGNFGAPLAFLLLTGGKDWWKRVKPGEGVNLYQAGLCLRVAGFLLLMGHGWLNLIEKKALMDQYTHLGFSSPQTVALWVGVFEVVAAISLLIRPLRGLLFFLILWKMGTELFYPHYELLEWVERGGSYGVLLALWLITKERSVRQRYISLAT
ncbi:hypothetical protein Q4E93_12290 [Flavitalea sp. BT771]|uniref:hypothetical protein n=1 Tax=Flavitalea sp. BT771 TaxID=3063329 RepID=UPI0026E425BF|nr:hypothetical protein [Flavitalea sp. BT771]MDO6431374.1 hypothetical protein [Flavitalea sp. BT771]MDV6220282.1 hypothetical protein [Flavitalea sp. BT771]